AFGSPGAGRTADSEAGENGIGASWAQGRGAGVGGPAMSQTAVREVRIAAGNAEAEAERAAAGSVRVETRQGTNELHGQAFFFDRQNSWGAQNPFTQWVENTGTAAAPSFTSQPFTPPDHEMAWGAGIGGHLRRDKLFWFAALDSYRRNDPGLSTVKLPI